MLQSKWFLLDIPEDFKNEADESFTVILKSKFQSEAIISPSKNVVITEINLSSPYHLDFISVTNSKESKESKEGKEGKEGREPIKFNVRVLD